MNTCINPTIGRTGNFNLRRSVLAATLLGGVLLAAGCSSAPRGEASRSGFGTFGTGTSVAESASSDGSNGNGNGDGDGGGNNNDNDGGNNNDDGNNNGSNNGGGGGGELEPYGDDGDDGDAPAPGPCDDVLATGASLLVSPGPAVLASGAMSSTLTVTNCGNAAIDWTAATVPTVALANAGGNLSSGSTSELGFTIDSGAYEPGAVNFKIKVSESGHNHYIDVHAFRELLGSDLVGDLGLSAGNEAGGCANQCITSALLSANLTSPNVTLEVATNTPAVINVYVSEQAPGEQDGHPAFPGVGPVATSGGETTNLTTPVSPLNAATKYYIIVEATDANGSSAYQSGSFTTLTPVDLPDQVVDDGPPPGCANQCITTALLTPQPDPTTMGLEVRTHTPALIDVYVSQDEPQVDNGEPSFGDDVDPIATTDGLDIEQWDTVLHGLQMSTDYHIIVRASDLSGNRSYQLGSLHTAHEATITARFHSVHVVHDGDNGDDNPGELSFTWGTDGALVGTRNSAAIHSGEAFVLDNDSGDLTVEISSDGGFLPTLYITAFEFDDADVIEYCAPQLHTSWGNWEDCGDKWNTASSGLITPASFAEMPRCSQFELPAEYADAPCMVLEAPDPESDNINAPPTGGDYPVFWAVVSFQAVA